MKSSLLEKIPKEIPQELIEVISGNAAVKIERIISFGHTSPEGFWYDQEQHEFVLLIQGRAQLEFEHGERLDLLPGDFTTLKPKQKHRVSYTAPDEKTIWLAVFF